MISKGLALVRNFSYAGFANLISLLISVIVVFFVPRFFGVEQYGLWQLYLFYLSYAGLLHFGWADGIYLRYGGRDYSELNRSIFFSQFWMLAGVQILISIFIISLTFHFSQNSERSFIFYSLAVSLVLLNSRTFLSFLLQATNRIKEYAQITLIDRLLYTLLITIFIIEGNKGFIWLIIADLIAKKISLLYSLFCCRDLIFQKISNLSFTLKEIKENISAGIKLMLSNISSMLIIGIVRFGIERNWDVATFGKVSLTLSVSNFMMVFISAMGLVLYPALRRANEGKLPDYYKVMRVLLMASLFGMLLIYYPLKVLVSAWLPNYQDSLIYMAILFPLCVYEGKMVLLINTYLKTLRCEKQMLQINFATVVVSLLATIITTLILKNLDMTVVSILFLLIFRNILAEITLSKKIDVLVNFDIFLELALTLCFVLLGWYIRSWWMPALYLFLYAIFLMVNYQNIQVAVSQARVFFIRSDQGHASEGK